MVEIGAGGGSIAHVDGMGRLQVGPESAGSEPGPASYGRGGTKPTVTDADILLGKIDPDKFAGGRVKLDLAAAESAMATGIGQKLDMSGDLAAFAVNEIVDENMANAARVHAIEWGKYLRPGDGRVRRGGPRACLPIGREVGHRHHCRPLRGGRRLSHWFLAGTDRV